VIGDGVSASEALETVASLVDAWCERRALAPLGLVLQAYPLSNPLTDGWAALLNALRDVRAFCDDALLDSERQQIEACIVAVEQVVYR
jgi:type VI protein secretion system component VasF